ncbi:MAG: hypothetical protein KGI37_04780 [Alphaproteobacteria bacterium]|nr:hypothetical protein [Alphaproteobacteria bacterium]
MSDAAVKLEEYRAKVAGTNIDTRSLLSTDYFNTFNSVIMLFDMLPEMPELLDEVEQWKFNDYVGHFRDSGLDFAGLAIESYAHVPPDLKLAFERKIDAMRIFVEEASRTLRRLNDAGETATFGKFARYVAELIRGMVEEGSAIVHGHDSSMDQSAIDAMF